MTFKDVPIGHIFRLPDCPLCIMRRVDAWAFTFVVRCEKHRDWEETSMLVRHLVDRDWMDVHYDPLAATLEAEGTEPH
jgi:hypothetical protein